MLIWQELWLDGASLYFHHSWTNWEARTKSFCTDKRSCIASSFLLPETDAIKNIDTRGFAKYCKSDWFH
jgi:hypothetical protein